MVLKYLKRYITLRFELIETIKLIVLSIGITEGKI
jgi:hypothetical protein